MSARLAGWMVAAMLGLAGCSTTVFESLPAGATTDCDPAWPGQWRALRGGESSRDTLAIAPDCRSVAMQGESKPAHLTLATSDAGQYLLLHNDDDSPDCIDAGRKYCGYALLRYQREGDVIRLYDADHAWVAAAIRRGGIQGHAVAGEGDSIKTDQPTFHNFLAGDGAAIAGLLRRHPEIFAAEPMIVLQRVAATPEAGAPMAEAANDAAPEGDR